MVVGLGTYGGGVGNPLWWSWKSLVMVLGTPGGEAGNTCWWSRELVVELKPLVMELATHGGGETPDLLRIRGFQNIRLVIPGFYALRWPCKLM